MVNYSLLQSLKRMIPVVLGSAVLVLFLAIPMAGAMERDMMQRQPTQTEVDRMQMGFEPQWYDPSGWFERGGNLEHETDWYDYTFAYQQSVDHGTWGPHGEQLPFGYFGERRLDGTGLYFDLPIELNYYTTDWYNREGILEGWL